MNNINIYRIDNSHQFISRASAIISKLANAAIDRHGKFHIVLSGGDTPKLIYQNLKFISTNWAVWYCWIGDERCLPSNDKYTNRHMIYDKFLNHVPIPKAQCYFIEGELGATLAAKKYQELVKNAPVFDLTLLGIGDDGHTASLFPAQILGDEPESPDVLAVYNSPKSPSQRVSLSARRLNQSREILFLVTGEKKQAIVNDFQNRVKMPASFIHGQEITTLLYCPLDIT
jgi:6-phosphogluconolactonase